MISNHIHFLLEALNVDVCAEALKHALKMAEALKHAQGSRHSCSTLAPIHACVRFSDGKGGQGGAKKNPPSKKMFFSGIWLM